MSSSLINTDDSWSSFAMIFQYLGYFTLGLVLVTVIGKIQVNLYSARDLEQD